MSIIAFVRDVGDIPLKLKSKGGIDSEAVEKRILSMQFNISSLHVHVEGDCAVIQGVAENQETREKAVLIVGNIKGIASVDDQMTLSTKDIFEDHYYTVVRGDTLSSIAQAHYGDALMHSLILIGNHPLLSDPEDIYPGQKLRIPPLDELKKAPQPIDGEAPEFGIGCIG